MNKESAASIIQEMQPEFAAIITEYLEKNISERR
jgi:flagellar motility protein MotE (MotC chaperone)